MENKERIIIKSKIHGLKITRELQFLLLLFDADKEGNIITSREFKKEFGMSKQNINGVLNRLRSKDLISSKKIIKEKYDPTDPRVEYVITQKGIEKIKPLVTHKIDPKDHMFDKYRLENIVGNILKSSKSDEEKKEDLINLIEKGIDGTILEDIKKEAIKEEIQVKKWFDQEVIKAIEDSQNEE